MTTDYKLTLTPITLIEDDQQLVREDETGKLFILTPIKTNVAKKQSDILLNDKELKDLSLEKNIHLKLISIGISTHARGFNYISDILTLIYVLADDKINLSKLYEKVSSKRKTHPDTVQRIIRSAIEQCEKSDYYFSVFKTKKCVTNKTFLMGIVSLLKTEIL